MADITMCAREECPRAEHCKRHPASGTKPNSLQSWFAPNDDQVGINGCDRFWAALSRSRMSEKPYWSVTVSVDGDPVLTIEPNMLAGHPGIEKFGDQIRAAGENLLAFIGDGSIPPCFICGATEGVDPEPDCPICKPEDQA